MVLRRPLGLVFLLSIVPGALAAQNPSPVSPAVFGYRDFTAQGKIEERFLAVPDAQLAGQHLKILTAEPHLAATPEDRKTAEYVARKFRDAGLDTEIVPYRVLLNQPKVIRVEAFDEAGHRLMTGPTREHVPGDPYQDDPRVVMPFNGSSGSGDVTGDAVYANYGRLEDFDQLAAQHIDLHGKVVICRYGANFRGVKVYIAEKRGAVGVLLYSDPQDDGYFKGDAYPNGPWRPETGVQRGSVQYLFKYAGDPETPGVASTMDLPDSARVSPEGNQPHIISIPISYADAEPILKALTGPGVPQGWQGALPFRYHVGQAGGLDSKAGVKVHLVSRQDYQRRIIWDVIGKIPGSEYPDDWVVVGNHRDAWVYGAVDPSSGTAAMLESVHGLGALLKQGWRPKRTILFCSWMPRKKGSSVQPSGSNSMTKSSNARLPTLIPMWLSPDRIFPQAPFLRSNSSSANSPAPSPAQPAALSTTIGRAAALTARSTEPPTPHPPLKRAMWAISAQAPTSRPSSSTWAFRLPT